MSTGRVDATLNQGDTGRPGVAGQMLADVGLEFVGRGTAQVINERCGLDLAAWRFVMPGAEIVSCAPAGETAAMPWLPADFVHPIWVAVSEGFHLRPITAADTDLDYPAVMGSRQRLWSIYGRPWGWPPAWMTYQQDRDDLARHEAEAAAHLSFNYALFDDAETALLGCVYIDPPERQGADAEISWWVVDSQVGTGLERALDALVPHWIATTWPFTQPRYVGRDLSWDAWLTLPAINPIAT